MKLVANPEAAIRRIIQDQVLAWNNGDGCAYSRHFAADGSFTNIYGQTFIGHAAFERRHIEILTTMFKGSTLVALIRRLRFLTPDVALASIDIEVRGVGTMPAGGPQAVGGVLRTQLLQVFVESDQMWRIEAHQNVAFSALAK